MGLVVVGVADMRICDDPADVLVTYALGSCIAVTAHDPVARVAGMLHFMLPESTIDSAKAERAPAMFADTGIPSLFRSVCQRGANKRRLNVRLVGGAQVMDAEGVFNIGKRNCLAARKILWKEGVLVTAESVGGEVSRSVRLAVDTGRVWLRIAGAAEEEMAGGTGPRISCGPPPDMWKGGIPSGVSGLGRR